MHTKDWKRELSQWEPVSSKVQSPGKEDIDDTYRHTVDTVHLQAGDKSTLHSHCHHKLTIPDQSNGVGHRFRNWVIRLFVDIHKVDHKSSHEIYYQKIDFLNCIQLNPLHLFEFSDSCLERKYQQSRTVQSTRGRSVYIAILYLILICAWSVMWLCLAEFVDNFPGAHRLLIVHAVCGLGIVSVTVLLTLYVCMVRKYQAAQLGSLVSHDSLLSQPNFRARRQLVARQSFQSGSTFRRDELSVPHARASAHYDSMALEVQPGEIASNFQERLKLGGLQSASFPELNARINFDENVHEPWWLPCPTLVQFCCTETPLLCLFGMLTISTCLSHTGSLHILSQCSLDSVYTSRLLRITLAMYALAMYWFTLCALLTSKSLFISPRKCVLLWTFQFLLLCVPPVVGRRVFASTNWEELLSLTLSMATNVWAFCIKTKVDLSSRMFFYTIWRQASTQVEKRKSQTPGTRTSMEDVLLLLSEIGRLAKLASTAGLGSARLSSLSIRLLSRVSECYELLTHYQDLFKVRVTGHGSQSLPFEYATIYGIELGNREGYSPHRGGDVDHTHVGQIPTYYPRRSLPARPTDFVHSFTTVGNTGQQTARYIRDVTGIKGHILELTYGHPQRSAKTADRKSLPHNILGQDIINKPIQSLNANDVIKKLYRGLLTQSDDAVPVRSASLEASCATKNKDNVRHSAQEAFVGSTFNRHLLEDHQKKVGASISSSFITSGQRRRRHRAATESRRRQKYIGTETNDHNLLGGLCPDDIPKRKLTESLEGIVGTRWTIDLFDLDAKCGGNILVEVGYALLGRSLSTIVQDNPNLVDRNILHHLHSHAEANDTCDNTTHKMNTLSHTPSGGMQDVQVSVLHLYVLMSFLCCLQSQYRSLPYHNSVHGAHVAHSTACLVNFLHLQGSPVFTPAIEIAFVLACLGHDVGHPGRNNQFFINSYDPLSVIYNDVSILENFHSCVLFMTLELENCNVLFPFTTEVFRNIRELIITLILATDMKSHFQHLSRFKVRRSNPAFCPYTNVEDLKLVLEICIKAGDLASSACYWAIHKEWCFRVAEEFYRQGSEEQKLGLPVSPLCDRSKHMLDFAKSQAGFIEFVTAPLFAELREIDEEDKCILDLENILSTNKARWEALSIDQALEDVNIPGHVQESGNSRRASPADAPPMSSEIHGSGNQRERFRRRRWRSIVGPISTPSPILMLDGKKNRRSKRTVDEKTTISCGDLTASSSWNFDEGAPLSSLTPSDRQTGFLGDAKSISTYFTRNSMSAETSDCDESTISLRRSWSNSSSDISLWHMSSDDDEISSLYHPAHKKMRRDYALSPSARVAPADIPNHAEMLDIIKRRASILTPNYK